VGGEGQKGAPTLTPPANFKRAAKKQTRRKGETRGNIYPGGKTRKKTAIACLMGKIILQYRTLVTQRKPGGKKEWTPHRKERGGEVSRETDDRKEGVIGDSSFASA